MSDSRRRVIVFGADGLGPAMVTSELMPHYARLLAAGTVFPNLRAACRPPERVGVTAPKAGAGPGRRGIMFNLMPLLVPALGERLATRGARLAVAASGSADGALQTNVSHPARLLEPGGSCGAAWLRRKLRPVREERGHTKYRRARWATAALIDVLLGDPDNRVLTLWLSEPDCSQTFYGPGSHEAVEACRVVDDCLGQLLQALAWYGLEDDTDMLLVSDHRRSPAKVHRNLWDHPADAEAALGEATADQGGGLAAAGNFIAGYGPGFRSGFVSELPAGAVDIAPTICALLGLDDDASSGGRVLAEGLTGHEAGAGQVGQQPGPGRVTAHLAGHRGKSAPARAPAAARS